jgi:hypothetical protein
VAERGLLITSPWRLKRLRSDSREVALDLSRIASHPVRKQAERIIGECNAPHLGCAARDFDSGRFVRVADFGDQRSFE